MIVFKTPADNRTDYIKRLIGLPGDKIQFIDENLYINNSEILKSILSNNDKIFCGSNIIDVLTFEEVLPNNKRYKTVYLKNNTFRNSDKFEVPEDYYFFLGDNRDCSKDSRFLMVLVMFIKIIWFEKHNLFFFHLIDLWGAFFLFGSGINQSD